MGNCDGYYLGNWPFTVIDIRDKYGSCYFGLPNQTAAQWAIDNGYQVGHDPDFPTGAGLFIILPEQPLASAPGTPNPTPPPEPTPTPTPTPTLTIPTCPDGFVYDPSSGNCIETAGSQSPPSPPAGPQGPTAPTGSWDSTPEGASLNNGWNYFLDVYNNQLPSQRSQLQDLANRAISG